MGYKIRQIVERVVVTAVVTAAAAAKLGAAGVLDGTRVRGALEWGYCATCMHHYHNDYIDETDGYRIDVTDTKWLMYSNAFLQAGVNLETMKHFSLGLYAGFAGVYQERRVFPATLRLTYFYKDYADSGFFTFVEGGMAFVFDDTDQKNQIARLGGGYRCRLSSRNSLDFNFFVQTVTDHPDIYNMNTSDKVRRVYLNCSDSRYAAAVFSVSFIF